MTKSNEWFDDFFDGLYGRVLAGQFSPALSRRQAALIARLLQLRKGQRVLDCPSGLGRIAIPLALRGLCVTGVDLSADYTRRARRAARRQGACVEFRQGDMRRIDFASEFHAVVNWFTSFGYFSDRQTLAFCRRVLRALVPGGGFLIEVINRGWLVRNLNDGIDETLCGVRIVNRPRWNPRLGRLYDGWTMSDGRQSRTRRSSLRVYSAPELRRMLRDAGFTEIQLLSHRDGRVGPFTTSAPRLIVLARRPR